LLELEAKVGVSTGPLPADVGFRQKWEAV
jgi:hypothetical protein